MTQRMTRKQWLAGIRKASKEVGECVEWHGPYLGKTPMLYTPKDYAWEGNCCGRQSARAVLFFLDRGYRLSKNSVIRPRCRNDRCVKLEHFYVIPRSHQVKEQAKRGELQTSKRKAALTRNARKNAKLTQEAVDSIRASRDPTKVESEKHGVSQSAIRAIRRGALWKNSITGASVFTWRPGQ